MANDDRMLYTKDYAERRVEEVCEMVCLILCTESLELEDFMIGISKQKIYVDEVLHM